MALIGNYNVISKSPLRFMSGTSISGDRSAFNQSGMNRSKFFSMPQVSAVPNGYAPGYSWVSPQKGGGMASYRQLSAACSITAASLAAARNAVAELAASMATTNADMGLIANLEAALSAAIVASNALLAAVAGMSATGLSAAIEATNAAMGAVVSMVSALSAQGAFTNAANFATANISADISSTTVLSPQSLANAVWEQALEGSLTSTEVMRLLLSVATGKTDIVDLGGGAATVTFRDVGDSKNRVTATMAGSERAAVLLNAT